jgi:outer membrane lipoprotein-sorting protein
MRTDETVKFRRDTRSKSTQDLEGEKMVVDENRTIMSDGKFHYQINNELKNVLKQKFDPRTSDTLDVRALLRSMENEYNEMKVLDDEKVGGYDCYVVEASGTYMEDDPEDPFIVTHKEVIWFAKDTGFPVKMEAYDKDGKVVRKSEFGEIKKDDKIDAKRFEFKAEGMVVSDRSGD